MRKIKKKKRKENKNNQNITINPSHRPSPKLKNA